MNHFNELHPDIIHTHILSRLDDTSLTSLSSVSSEFRRMICNDYKLWKSVCTSNWPYVRCWNLAHLSRKLYFFPCGYRSFVPVSDAFPSLRHYNNTPSHSQLIDLPPTKDFIFAFAMYLQGQPGSLYTTVGFLRDGILREYHMSDINAEDCFNVHSFDINNQDMKEGWKEYFQENFRLNLVIINPILQLAGSLFHSGCKPVSVEQTSTTIELLYTTVIPKLPGLYMEMVKFHVRITFSWRKEEKRLCFGILIEKL